MQGLPSVAHSFSTGEINKPQNSKVNRKIKYFTKVDIKNISVLKSMHNVSIVDQHINLSPSPRQGMRNIEETFFELLYPTAGTLFS